MEKWWGSQPFSERKVICRTHLLDFFCRETIKTNHGEAAQQKLEDEVCGKLFSAITDVNAFMVLYGDRTLRSDFVKYLKLSKVSVHGVARAVRESFQKVYAIDAKLMSSIGQNYHKLTAENIGNKKGDQRLEWEKFRTHAPLELIVIAEFLLNECDVVESAASICEASLLITVNAPELEVSQLSGIAKWEPTSTLLAYTSGQAIRLLGEIYLRWLSLWLTVALDYSLINEENLFEAEEIEKTLDGWQNAGVKLGRATETPAVLLLPPAGSDARKKVEPQHLNAQLKALGIVQRRLLSLVWANDEKLHAETKRFREAASLCSRIIFVLPRRLTPDDIMSIRDPAVLDSMLSKAKRLYDATTPASRRKKILARHRTKLYQSPAEVHAAAEAQQKSALVASRAASLFKKGIKK